MISKRALAAAILAVTAQSAGAAEVVAAWSPSGGSAPDFTFHLDLLPTALADAYTLNGYLIYSGPSGNREAVTGSATRSPNENAYTVSLFFNSNTGETFSIGANVDTTTLSGPGTLIRVAHGSVGSDQSGTLAVVP
jgi:hypothetical protein